MRRSVAVLRSLASLLLGLLVITMVAESIEFVLVGTLRGDFSQDPERYFATRNRPAVLSAKMFYNFFAAAVGGAIAYLMAPAKRRLHVLGLAALQVAALVFALITPSLSSTGPLWMWASLIPVSVLGVSLGAVVVERRQARPPHVTKSALGKRRPGGAPQL